VLKFFSDRHRFFLLTDKTVVHKYNIHNHIPREYGHQLRSNLNVSTVPVFHGSRTSPTLLSNGAQQQLQCYMYKWATLFLKGPKITVKHFSFKGPPNFTDF